MAAITGLDSDAILASFGLDDSHPEASRDDLEARAEAWVRSLLGSAPIADALVVGRIAWLACDGPGRWRDQFLAPEPSAEFVAAFRAAVPQLVPEAAPMIMPEQSLHPSSRPTRRSRLAQLFGLTGGGEITAQ